MAGLGSAECSYYRWGAGWRLWELLEQGAGGPGGHALVGDPETTVDSTVGTASCGKDRAGGSV